MSIASERANGRASGPVLQPVFLVVPAHSGFVEVGGKEEEERKRNRGGRK